MTANPADEAETDRRQAAFVTMVDPSIRGAWENVCFKRSLLESLGFETAISSVERRPVKQWAKLYAAAAKRVKRSDLVYVRLELQAAPIVLWARILKKPALIEANGFVIEDSQRSAPVTFVLKHLLRAGVRSRRAIVLGDSGYRAYVLKEFLSPQRADRWRTLPLAALGDPDSRDTSDRSAGPNTAGPATWQKTVMFLGQLLPSQGIPALVEAFASVAPADWRLSIVGSGEPDPELVAAAGRDARVSLEPAVSSAQAGALMRRAGVLAAPYENARGAGYPISSLKSVAYAVTDRPLVLNGRDSLLETFGPQSGTAALPESAGMFVSDGTAAGLASALQRAIAAAESGATYPERRATVLAERGHEGQRRIVAAALADLGVLAE